MSKKKADNKDQAWSCTTYYWSAGDEAKERLKGLRARNKRHREYIRNFEQRKKLSKRKYELDIKYCDSVISLYQSYIQANEADIKIMSATPIKKRQVSPACAGE
jgi:hypothetical protein